MAALIRRAAPVLTLIAIVQAAGAPLAWSQSARERPGRAVPAAKAEASAMIERWRPIVAEASRRFGVPQAWITGVIEVESGGRTRLNDRPIVSRAGAMGLMQLMPGTWAAMRREHGLGSDPHDPRDNIMAGTAYLRAMYDRFGYPGLFAAYNAGPARYEENLRDGRTLPAETRAYVMQLVGTADGPEPALHDRSGSALFFALSRQGRGKAESLLIPVSRPPQEAPE